MSKAHAQLPMGFCPKCDTYLRTGEHETAIPCDFCRSTGYVYLVGGLLYPRTDQGYLDAHKHMTKIIKMRNRELQRRIDNLDDENTKTV